MNASKKLKALYYPYSRLQSEVELKRAILAFDEIYFVDPLARDIAYDNPSSTIIQNDPQHIWYRDPLSTDECEFAGFSWPGWERIREAYAFLQEMGVVHIYDPSPIVKEYADPLLLSHSYSRTEENFLSYFDRINDPEILLWVMPEARIPKSNSNEVIKIIKGFRFGPERTTTLKIRPWMEKRNRLPENLVALHVTDAFPLILDQALMICEKEKMIPLTDDPKANAYLIKRYSQLSQVRPSGQTSRVSERDFEEHLRFENLTVNVIGRMISDEALEKRSFSEIYKYRAGSQEALARFRAKLWKLTFDLETTAYEPKFQTEVKKIIEQEILPEVQVLNNTMKDVYRKMFGDVAGKIGQAALTAAATSIPTLTIASISGLSPGLIVALGASTFLSALGISLPSIFAYIDSKRDAKRNFVHYLWNFSKKDMPIY